jgi:hypothetical protein
LIKKIWLIKDIPFVKFTYRGNLNKL